MLSRFIFKVEAAEKIKVGSGFESGDTIISAEYTNLTQAKKAGEKLLKRKDIFSVWVTQLEVAEYGDPIYQWKKYESDSKWTGGDYW